MGYIIIENSRDPECKTGTLDANFICCSKSCGRYYYDYCKPPRQLYLPDLCNCVAIPELNIIARQPFFNPEFLRFGRNVFNNKRTIHIDGWG